MIKQKLTPILLMIFGIFLIGMNFVPTQQLYGASNLRIMTGTSTTAYMPLFRTNVALLNGTFDQLGIGWSFSGELGGGYANDGIDGASGLVGDATLKGQLVQEVPLGYGEIRQRINVPADGGTLEFDYEITTYDTMYVPAENRLFDTFEVYIKSEPTEFVRDMVCMNPAHIGTPMPINEVGGMVYCHGNSDDAPDLGGDPLVISGSNVSIPLSQFSGESVELIFRVYNRNDGFFNTFAYIDNVEIK
ncbi:MAG: hypothetical protein AAF633_28635 [Chloroflexota bacterium]